MIFKTQIAALLAASIIAALIIYSVRRDISLRIRKYLHLRLKYAGTAGPAFYFFLFAEIALLAASIYFFVSLVFKVSFVEGESPAAVYGMHLLGGLAAGISIVTLLALPFVVLETFLWRTITLFKHHFDAADRKAFPDTSGEWKLPEETGAIGKTFFALFPRDRPLSSRLVTIQDLGSLRFPVPRELLARTTPRPVRIRFGILAVFLLAPTIPLGAWLATRDVPAALMGLAISAFAILASAIPCAEDWALLRRGNPASGMIESVTLQTSDSTTYVMLVVAYEGPDKTLYRKHGQYGFTHKRFYGWPTPKAGDSVLILYDPLAPGRSLLYPSTRVRVRE